MSFMFGKPKKVQEISVVQPPKVTQEIPRQETVVREEKKKLRKGREKRKTLLTGPRGILTKPPVSQKTLLGQ